MWVIALEQFIFSVNFEVKLLFYRGVEKMKGNNFHCFCTYNLPVANQKQSPKKTPYTNKDCAGTCSLFFNIR